MKHWGYKSKCWGNYHLCTLAAFQEYYIEIETISTFYNRSKAIEYYTINLCDRCLFQQKKVWSRNLIIKS